MSFANEVVVARSLIKIWSFSFHLPNLFFVWILTYKNLYFVTMAYLCRLHFSLNGLGGLLIQCVPKVTGHWNI